MGEDHKPVKCSTPMCLRDYSGAKSDAVTDLVQLSQCISNFTINVVFLLAPSKKEFHFF